MVFGLFKMLGYRFSPRLRDLSDQRFWRAEMPGEPAGDYGPLNAGWGRRALVAAALPPTA
jgi:hypothetical protein